MDISIQEPYFKAIQKGLKRVEGRLAKPKFLQIHPGSFLRINNLLEVKVIATRRYPSFAKMLESEGLSQVLPGVSTIEEGISIYHSFYTSEEEQSFGVIAIEIKI